MPIDLNSWLAGIANINYGFTVPTKRIMIKSLFDNVFTIVWMFSYIYFFHSLMYDNHPLIALHNGVFHSPSAYWSNSYLSLFCNNSLFTDSYILNFVSLTIQIEKCLLKCFSKCVTFVVCDQVVSTVSCIMREIHHSRKKISDPFRFFLIFWVSLSLLNQFPNDNIAEIQLLMAGDIHPHPGQVNIGLKFCHWNLNGIKGSGQNQNSANRSL